MERVMSQKVLMVANTSWYLYNFRLPLARHLRDIGYEVVFVSPKDAYSERLMAEKFRWIHLDMNRKGMNPLRELFTVGHFWKIYRSEKPAVCHHFTIKCVLYGTVAAKLSGVKAVVNAITGLGHAYIGNGWLHRILRPFLRIAYRKILRARRVQVIFQNGDDFAEFQTLKMVNEEKTTIIRGSGVCLRRFAPRPGPLEGQPSPTVLLASRLIKEKGLMEYIEAARILKEKGVAVSFALAGQLDPGNPSSITEETLQAWCTEGIVDYLGQIDRIEDVLGLATIVALPSYREGTPRILLEAAAMGKPIVATDVPGCREVVQHGFNGLLVPVRNALALAEAIEQLLSQPETMCKMGENGRCHAHHFEESTVIQATLGVYQRAHGTPIQDA
jgi:glycosyltransferase involved in cell wall biosynthesis